MHNRKWFWPVGALVMVPATVAVARGALAGTGTRTVRIGDGPRFRVEVADTAAALTRGLMDREDVPSGTGMLFLLGRTARASVTMRNTLVPLDIAWMRDGWVLGVTSMVPCPPAVLDCPSYPSPGPVDSALEVPAGELRHVRAGDRVTVRHGGVWRSRFRRWSRTSR